MALFKQSLIFLKRLLWTFIRSAEDKTSASCLLPVEHYSAEVNLIFTVGRWNYEWTHYFMYICENVQSHESKCTIPKRISSCLVIFWSAMQFFLHYFFRMVFYSVATHNISLFLLLEKYLFLCKYPRGYFVSKCRDTVKKLLMIFKDNNSNIHFIVNYFNDWYKDEYFIGLFFLLQTNVLLRQSLFEYLSCFSHKYYFLQS